MPHLKERRMPVKKTALKAAAIFALFFIGTCSLLMLDTICAETTGEGGKLVLDVDKWPVFQ